MSEKYRVLIVDDDKASLKIYEEVLKEAPEFKVDEAKRGKGAIRKIKKCMPDIILFDRHTPDMDGLAFCRFLKEDPDSSLANIYLIMVGDKQSDEEKVLCINEGADDYITRPFKQEELLARVRVGQRIANHLKKVEKAKAQLFQEMDVLLIQEGGCAPGYNPVTAFITHNLEDMGREVYATWEGFKSLVSGRDEDFLRLVYDREMFKKLDHLPGVFHAAPLSESRGAQLRSERYRDFLNMDVQKMAVTTVRKRKVNALIAIGGNGTFRGIQSLCDMLPTSVQAFFIPVTIDSDVAGTDCIGQHTGVEMGAEKIRCYMADARTHKRIYIVEMMGASSGFHALHSCLGARAHLAVLPDSQIDHRAVIEALNKRDEAVIVVAEGYKRAQRRDQGIVGNAAEFFYSELLDTGIAIKRKVVCEPFSRDIRGAAPNNQDITLAQRIALNVASYLDAGTSRLMPAVQTGREYAIPFNEIQTDNMKAKDLLVLSDRLTTKNNK